MNNVLALAAVLLVSIACTALAQTSQTSTCAASYTTAAGVVYPLSYIANQLYILDNVNINGTLYDLQMQLCQPVPQCPSTHTHPAGYVPAGCQIKDANTSTPDYRFMGTLNETSFYDIAPATGSLNGFGIMFSGGDKCHSANQPFRSIALNIYCDPNGYDTDIDFLGENSYCVYDFMIASPYVCPGYNPNAPSPRPHKKHLSGGSIVLIVFFVALFLYFAVGMAYKGLVVGAVGVEMIPQINFWRSLPGLIIDGLNYIITCGKVRPIANTYDNI